VINSNLGRILHRLATIHLLQTDRRRDRQTTTTTKDRPLCLQLNGRPKQITTSQSHSTFCQRLKVRFVRKSQPLDIIIKTRPLFLSLALT